jgi:hypothetical protein
MATARLSNTFDKPILRTPRSDNPHYRNDPQRATLRMKGLRNAIGGALGAVITIVLDAAFVSLPIGRPVPWRPGNRFLNLDSV